MIAVIFSRSRYFETISRMRILAQHQATSSEYTRKKASRIRILARYPATGSEYGNDSGDPDTRRASNPESEYPNNSKDPEVRTALSHGIGILEGVRRPGKSNGHQAALSGHPKCHRQRIGIGTVARNYTTGLEWVTGTGIGTRNDFKPRDQRPRDPQYSNVHRADIRENFGD